MSDIEIGLPKADLSRRTLLRGLGLLGASVASMSLLAACGDDDDDATVPPAAGPTPVPDDDDDDDDSPEVEPTPDDDDDSPEVEPTPDDDDDSVEGAPAGNQVLVVAQPQDVSHFDPHRDFTIHTEAVRRNLYDTLIFRNDDLELEPGLAEAWEVVDELTYEFTLRSGVSWHDGTAFTADDVKFSLDRLRDPETSAPHRSLYLTIEDVEIVDDSTIRITTSVPDPIIPKVLPGYGGYIISKSHFETVGEDYGEQPIGTGPFKLVEWSRDSQVRLEANPDYWRGAPILSEVIFRAIPDQSTRASELLTGGVDIVKQIHPSQVSDVDGSDIAQVRDVPGLFCLAIRFNSLQEPVDDIRVRKAMAHAIDMDAIIESLLDGFGERIPVYLSSHHFGFNPELNPYEFDLEKARELLAEAGLTDISIDLNITSNQPTHQEIAEVIVAQWSEVGINAELKVTERANFVDVYYRGELNHAIMIGWGGWTVDADNTYWNLISSDGQANFRSGTIFYSNEEADGLISQAREELDQDTREQLYWDTGVILHEEAPILPLYQQVDLWGVANRVQGFQVPYDERLWLWPVSLSE